MLRASPLKPTRDSVPRPCKPLKRLDLNFKCLGEVHQLIGSSSGISSTASTNFSCKCRARLVERFRVLGAAARRLNFKCLGEVHQLIGSSLGISSTASTNFSCKCRARLVERLRVLGAAARRLMLLKREKMNRRIKSADFKKK